jgi:hypothetical protein
MRNVVQLLAFHDERLIPNWLYHGFVLCEVGKSSLLREKLIKAKNECCCSIDKRIRFSKLTSKSAGSTKTRTAAKWARMFIDELYQILWFYFFGINLPNIDYELFGPSSDGQERDFRIYNRFFEIGLFSACRFFFDSETEDVEILQIFSEKRDLEEDNPFLIHAPYKINKRESNVKVKSKQVIQVASSLSREIQYPEYVHVLNFVDILTGSFSQVIDYTTRKDGCTEVADKVFPVCLRMSENPYNKNSRYYKRCSMSFFPKHSVSKLNIMDYGIRPPPNQFYWNRVPRLYQLQCIPGFDKFLK